MGEVAGFKMPTMQAMNPPIEPASSSGPRIAGWVQANAAAPKQSSNEMPVC